MANRFYQYKLKSGPLYWEEIGQRVNITGVVLEGEGLPIVVMTPTSSSDYTSLTGAQVLRLSQKEWSQLIQCSDKPEIFQLDSTGGVKAVMRKVRYEVSGAVQQKVWVRDGLKCMFCEKPMGEVQLTVDHFIPLELGGANTPSNYLSACRKCNKRKGAIHPEQHFTPEKYNSLCEYLVKIGDEL